MHWLGTVIAIIVTLVVGNFIYQEVLRNEWAGIYESRTSNDTYKIDFASREECRDWLIDAQSNPGQFTNHECGKNCEPPKTPYGLYVCKETF